MNIRLSDRCHHCHFVVDCSTNFSVSSDPFDSSKIHPWFSHIPNISHPGKFNYAASERSVRNIVAIGAKILEEDVPRKLDRTRVIGRILGRRTFVSRSPLIKLCLELRRGGGAFMPRLYLEVASKARRRNSSPRNERRNNNFEGLKPLF